MSTAAKTIAHRVAEALEARLPEGTVLGEEERAIIAQAIGDDVLDLPAEPAWHDGGDVIPVVRTVIERRTSHRDEEPDAELLAARAELLDRRTYLGNRAEREVNEVDGALRNLASYAAHALAELHNDGRLPIGDGFGSLDNALKALQRARDLSTRIDTTINGFYRESKRNKGPAFEAYTNSAALEAHLRDAHGLTFGTRPESLAEVRQTHAERHLSGALKFPHTHDPVDLPDLTS